MPPVDRQASPNTSHCWVTRTSRIKAMMYNDLIVMEDFQHNLPVKYLTEMIIAVIVICTVFVIPEIT
jgi:hypothetical protein